MFRWNKYLIHRTIGLNTWWRNICWQAQRSDICCSFSAGLYRSSSLQIVSKSLGHPVPLAEKHPQSIKFPPPCFTVGMVFLGLYSAFLFLQTLRVKLMPNSYILVSSDHITFSQAPPDNPGVLWQTSDGPVHVPSSAEEPCAQQYFNPSRCSVLLMVLFVTVVQTAFRSLTSSSCVVLGWSITFLIIIEIPRGEILHGAPDWGRLAGF